MMDPITLILTALAGGISAGITNSIGTEVSNAYADLRGKVVARLGGKRELVEAYEAAPTGQSARDLAERLQGGDSVDVATLQAAAARLLALLEPKGTTVHVDASHAQGVYIGDHGVQKNEFH